MSVAMARREATTASRLMSEKEVVMAAVPGGAAGVVLCGVKRGLGVERAIVEVDERGYGEGGELSSESSSSIGEAEDEDESSLSVSTSSGALDRGEEAEVQSRWSKGHPRSSLVSLESLEESLPIKRGLSSFFNGKSKSFASLSDASSASTTARDLAKPENPFNKRRRILVTCRPSWRRRASYGSLVYSSSSSPASASASSSPTAPTTSTTDLSSLESEEEVEAYGEGDDSRLASPSQLQPALLRFHQGSGGGSKEWVGPQNKASFRSPRSFSLCDLR